MPLFRGMTCCDITCCVAGRCCAPASQMLQYEITRKQLLEKQQKKIEALEARAAELQKQKVEHEKAWASAQRERELQKVRSVSRLDHAHSVHRNH
jgi:hypothetical protein